MSTACFQGSGSFSTEKGLKTISQLAESTIATMDLTGTVQVQMDVRYFNYLIGITKDINNVVVTETSYDSSNDVFPTDDLSLNAATFVHGIKNSGNDATSNIISVGKFSDFYSNFGSYLANYFALPIPSNISSEDEQGISTGQSTLFSNEYNFYPNNGIFDKAELLKMFDAKQEETIDHLCGNEVTARNLGFQRGLSGVIGLGNITKSLRYAVETNCFGNRNNDPDNIYTNTASENVHNHTNYGVSDGFVAGDVITISGGGLYSTSVNGIDLNLSLAIDPVFASTSGEILLTRTLGTHLVIHLVNLSKTSLAVASSISTNSSISMSVTGNYASYSVERSTTQDGVYVPLAAAFTVSTFVDTNLAPSTLYHYNLVPRDSNNYQGMKLHFMTMTSA